MAKSTPKQSRAQAGPARGRKAAGQKRGVAVRTTGPSTKNTRLTASKKSAGKKGTRATTVLGVPLPKGLTSALDSLVNSQRGRELLASALVAAAGAAAAALVKPSDGDPVEARTQDLSSAAAAALAEVATGAVRSLLSTSGAS